MISSGIVGLGKAVPEKVLTNFDLESLVDTTDQWIVERTGIRERRVASEIETSASLGSAAGREALGHAGIAPESVDLIIVATTTPDMFFPSTACLVQQQLGCINAAAFDLSAACAGFPYAIAVASQFVSSGAMKYVLVIGADVLTKFTDWTDRGTCILFGDGAGAAVIAPVDAGEGVLAFDLGADGTGGELLKIEGGAGRNPASEAVLAAKSQYIFMNGREVFKFAVKIMGESSERALAKCGLTADQVDWFVPHQANIRIIDSAVRRLGIDASRVFTNVHKYGNTSAASIPIALYEAWHKGKFNKKDNIVIVGFGAGLTWSSCVINWSLAPSDVTTDETLAAATGGNI